MEATSEMKEYFLMRTRAHLFLVRKWSDIIAKLNDPRIDRELLDQERDDHDQYKFVEPEYTPYLFITWNYYCKRKHIRFQLSEEMQEKMHVATFHHIKNHKHHPEYWDPTATLEGLNKDDRDRPAEGKLIDGRDMPLTYVASMVADWCAMSEELGTNSPREWAERNVNIRWQFTSEQTDFIYELIDKVWK